MRKALLLFFLTWALPCWSQSLAPTDAYPPGGCIFDTTPTDWTQDNGTVGCGNESVVAPDEFSFNFVSPGAPAPTTGHTLFMVGTTGVPERAATTISDLSPGTSYVVNLDYAYGNNSTSPQCDVLGLSIDGQDFFVTNNSATSAARDIWYTDQFTFTAQSDTASLLAGGLGNSAGDSCWFAVSLSDDSIVALESAQPPQPVPVVPYGLLVILAAGLVLLKAIEPTAKK